MSRFDYVISGVIVYIMLSIVMISSADFIFGTMGITTPSVLGDTVSDRTINVSDTSIDPEGSIETTDLEIEEIADDIGRYKILKGKPLDPSIAELDQGFSLAWPVEGGVGTVTQCFDEVHNGVDIADHTYPNILAGEKGKVILAGCYGICPPAGVYSGGSGLARTVMIEHENGLISVYGHLHEIYVEEGDEVGRGQIIAKMGQTGEVRGGVHLHFSLLKNIHWDLVDPTEYLEREVCIGGLPDPEAFYGEYEDNAEHVVDPNAGLEDPE